MHITDVAKYVDPTSYANAMSRSDAKLWQKAFDKEMNGLVSRKVFSVVDRPADRNPLWHHNDIQVQDRPSEKYSDTQVPSVPSWRLAKGRCRFL